MLLALQTAAAMQVHGIEIDFVNLRSETYADSSRIPEATIGTPQQARAVRATKSFRMSRGQKKGVGASEVHR